MLPGEDGWRWTLARGVTNLAWGDSTVSVRGLLAAQQDRHQADQ